MKLFSRRNVIINSIRAYMASSLQFAYTQEKNDVNKDKSIIWLWLGGGPTHFETFNAVGTKEGFESVVGQVRKEGSPIVMGGLWNNLSEQSHNLNVVANFSHRDSSHLQATHWMNTGHFNPDRTTTATSKYPSYGSIISAVHGPANLKGVPAYVTQSRIDGDQPAWLGGAYKGFDPSAKDNLSPRVDIDRFTSRKDLLDQFDRAQIASDADKYKDQAFDVVLGDAKSAFNDSEWESAKSIYGDTAIGKQLWYAERLASYGSKFVTIHYGGWDMHSDIKNSLERLVPPVDFALAATINSLSNSGRLKDTMIIVTGEFGRTKLNASNGRDHWSNITPLLVAGGEYEYNRVIGKADEYNYSPESLPYGPIDLQATIFHHLEINPKIMRIDNSGRPRYLLEGEAKNILI